jgi:hypothetical protein
MSIDPDRIFALSDVNGSAPLDTSALRIDPIEIDEAAAVEMWRHMHGPIPMGRRVYGRFRIFPKPDEDQKTMKTMKIELGEREFELRMFTLRQVRDIDVRLHKRGDDVSSNFDLAVDLIEIALRDEMPDMTGDKLNALRGTGNQLLTALRRIIAFANGGTDGEEIAVAAAEQAAALDAIDAAANGN